MSQTQAAGFDDLVKATLKSVEATNVDLQALSDFKDVLAGIDLPTSFHIQLVALVARLQGSLSELCGPLFELTRLVELYSEAWNDKAAALKGLHESYNEHQNQLTVALTTIQRQETELEKHRYNQHLMLWERMYSRAMNHHAHGRRWKYLVESYRQQAEAGLPLTFASDSEDSDDELDDLYVKPSSKGRQHSKLIKQLRKRHQEKESPRQGSAGPAATPLHARNEQLQREIEELKAQLDSSYVRPEMHSIKLQTDIESARSSQEREADLITQAALASTLEAAQADEARSSIHMQLDSITGWCNCTPSDLRVEVRVYTASNSKQVKSISQTLDFVPLNRSDVHLGYVMDLDVVERTDRIEINVLGGGLGARAKVFAIGHLTGAQLLEAARHSTMEKTLSAAVKLTAKVDSHLDIALRTTRLYNEHRQDLGAEPDACHGLAIHLKAAWTPLPEWKEASKPASRVASGTPTRRRKRLEDALAKDEPTTDAEAAEDLFELLEASEEDLDQPNFTMQEMMDLALLHTRQMQALELKHEEALDRLRHKLQLVKAGQDVDVDAGTDALPTPPRRRNSMMQTDPSKRSPRPSQRQIEYVEVEKVVERIVEKIKIVKEEVIVEVPVPMPQASSGVPDRRAPRYDPARYASTLPQGFLRRLLYYTKKGYEHRQQLETSVNGARSDAIEQQLASKFLLDTNDKDVQRGLTATFMPAPTAGPGAQARYTKSYHSFQARYGLGDQDSLPPLQSPSSSQSAMTNLNMSSFVVDTKPPSRRPSSKPGSQQGRALRQQGLLPNGRPINKPSRPTEGDVSDANQRSVNELNLSFSKLTPIRK
eukprot:TRINITY_DN11492_c6_g4_i1.p1 TRINITY_DN11492_c6_g4~~TRINITY_DN11492_c6_g4_i1.p1  ORF type:complete len:825 (+),score=183.12 TRINITY_DN11492_c6_g4_i1:82-2556(+)